MTGLVVALIKFYEKGLGYSLTVESAKKIEPTGITNKTRESQIPMRSREDYQWL